MRVQTSPTDRASTVGGTPYRQRRQLQRCRHTAPGAAQPAPSGGPACSATPASRLRHRDRDRRPRPRRRRARASPAPGSAFTRRHLRRTGGPNPRPAPPTVPREAWSVARSAASGFARRSNIAWVASAGLQVQRRRTSNSRASVPRSGRSATPTTPPDGVPHRSVQDRVHPHHRLPRRPVRGRSATSRSPPPAGSTGTTSGASTTPLDDDLDGVRAGPLRDSRPRAATRIGAAQNLGRFRPRPRSCGGDQATGEHLERRGTGATVVPLGGVLDTSGGGLRGGGASVRFVSPPSTASAGAVMVLFSAPGRLLA